MVEHYHGWWKQTLRSQQVNQPFEWRFTSDRHHVSQEAQTKVLRRNAFIDNIISSSGLDDDLSDHYHLAQPIPSANPFLHTQKDDGQLLWQTKMISTFLVPEGNLVQKCPKGFCYDKVSGIKDARSKKLFL